MNLPRFAVTHKSLILVALTLVLVWSISSAFSMQRREDPGTVQRVTQIITIWPGASTHNVEELVTKKIADDLRGVAHVDHVTGTSKVGVSSIFVDLDDYVNERTGEIALREIRNHLDDLRGQLPAGIQGPTIVPHFWDTYPVVLGVTAPGFSARELRDIAKKIGDDISRLPDVGEVQMVGDQEQQVNVDLDVRRLADYAVSPLDVTNALARRNALMPGGTAQIGGRAASVTAPDTLQNAQDVADTTVTTIDGRTVRVGDLATVQLGYPDPPDELVRVRGKPAVALAVMARATSSVTQLTPEIRPLVARELARYPAGVHVTFIADQPTTVDKRLFDFTANLALGIVFATVLVALFMGLRNGLLVATTIVLSIVLTLGVMPLLSIDLQQISIISLIIAIGMVVDAGIVAVDNIERLLAQGVERQTAAWQGVSQLWFPLLTSTLVGMSSFVPFLLLGGGVGNFVHDLGLVVAISLSMSLLVAYFVTPIIGEWFAIPAGEGTRNRVLRWIETSFERLLETLRRLYQPVAHFALRHAWQTAAAALLLVILAGAYVPRLGQQFFPPADRSQFIINVTAPDGTDLYTTLRYVEQVESVLDGHDDITSYAAFVGHGAPKIYYNVIPEAPSTNYAQFVVNTKDVAAANRLIDTLRAQTQAQIAGARVDVKKLEQGPPVGAPIQIRLDGEDAHALALASAQVQSMLRGISGTFAVRDSAGTPSTKLAVNVDNARASLAGVDEQQVRALLALAYTGSTPGSIREEDRETPVVVRFPSGLRHDASALGAIPVRNAAGSAVPLSEVASVALDTDTGLATVRDGQKIITVSAEVADRLPSAALADFRKAAKTLHLPTGVSLSYAGEDEQSSKSLRQLLMALLVGLMLNQLILIVEFRALRLSLVILSAVPLGLFGAVLGLGLTHSPFGFTAALGIAGLGGVVTNHTIVLFEYARRELEHGGSLEEALIVAGKKRVRPILLTVVTSIVALLPLALAGGGLWPPFCWAIIFGLAGSMVMTLVAIPAIYRMVGRGVALTTEHGEPHEIDSAIDSNRAA
ncbi:MAG TPA: efflux RND transporter permease subunit [Candidatus Binatus sp.]|nr:efflux RND transporter permease subunit [Candidatus Binatus sp.]